MISVVLPTYNRSSTILHSLNSVLSQTLTDFEVIVVDDASTDNSIEILKSISNPKIRCIRNETNRGAAYTRNVGVQNSSHELIAFLDSDDTWHPNYLETQLCRYQKAEGRIQAQICHHTYHTPNGPLVRPEGNNADLPRKILRYNFFTPQVMLIRRDVFLDLGGFDINCPALEDWEFGIRFLERYNVGVIEENLVDIFHSENSLTTHLSKQISGHDYIYRKHRQSFLIDPFTHYGMLRLIYLLALAHPPSRVLRRKYLRLALTSGVIRLGLARLLFQEIGKTVSDWFKPTSRELPSR